MRELLTDREHRGPRLIFLRLTEEAKLEKVQELLMGGDGLGAAIDRAGTLYVAVDGVPYLAAFSWSDGKYQEATDARSKAVTALLRDAAVKEGERQLSCTRPSSLSSLRLTTGQAPSRMQAWTDSSAAGTNS